MTRKQARRLQSVRRWHRRGALVVAIWLAVLAITGSAINRAHDWGLDRAPLPGFIQRAVYGIETVAERPCAGLARAPQACDRAFARFTGAAGNVVLTPHEALLLAPDGALIEALPAGQLGLSRIDAGFAGGGRIYLRGGERIVSADTDLLELRAPDADEQVALRDAEWLRPASSAPPLTWERLLLDLHAARFLGPAARGFTDLMAALILVLVVSGLWLYRLRGRSGER